MRRVKRSGLAGVPGVVLTERDRRHLASCLGVTPNGTSDTPSRLGGVPECDTCAPGASSTDTALAARVLGTLGSPELTDAVMSPGHSRFLTDAARLAAATREAMKFRKGEVAVLSGITSPQFAVLAGKTAKSLRNKVPEPEHAAVLLLFITGAVDSAAGRRTFLARDFNKAQKDLTAALGTVGAGKLAGLVTSGVPEADGIQSIAVWNLNGAGSLGSPTTPSTAVLSPSDPRRFYPPERKKDPKDLGTATRAPDALDFVPFDRTIRLLGTVGATAGGAAAGKLRAWAKANPLPTSTDRITAAAQRAAAWIIRTATDATLSSSNAWDAGAVAWLTIAGRYGATVPQREGSASAFGKHVAKMLVMAAKQCVQRTGQTGKMTADGVWVEDENSTTEQIPSGPEAAKYVGRWDKINVDPKIRPAAVLLVQEAYQFAYRKEPTLHALNWFGSFGYGLGRDRSGLLKKAETAPGFTADVGGGEDVYGRYLDFWMFQLTPLPPLQLQIYWRRVGELESLRAAGAAPPPQDVQNNVNVFMSVFNAMGPALSVVLNAINTSVKFASETLCYVFKVLAGPEVGNVLCAVFDAILKLLGGITKGAFGVLASVGKALLGFLGKLSSGDWMGALYELFVGLNTAIIYAIGSPIADFMGVPFTKADEKGDPEGPDFVPSMERMGESLTRKNPLFLVMLTLNVISLVFKPTPANAGALMITLSPILAMTMAPSVGKALRATKDPWLENYRLLKNSDIERAITNINKILVGVVIGFVTTGDATKIFLDRMAKFAEKEGGAGPATAKALQFFVNNLQGRLTSITFSIVSMMQLKEGFEFKILVDDLVGLATDFLILIPAFAIDTGVFDKDSLAVVSVAATTGATTVEQAYDAYNDIVRTLDEQARAAVAAQIAADAAEGTGGAELAPFRMPKKERAGAPPFALLAIAAAAGFTVAFMFKNKA